MYVGLLFFFNLLFITFTQAVMECNPTDSMFTQTKDSLVVEGGQWKDVSKIDGDQRCISKCHVAPQCRSAIVNDDTCTLRDVNRMGIGSQITKQPNTKYYEKQKCTGSALEERFIALVSHAIDCKDIYNTGWKVSGVYGISKDSEDIYQPIRCEMSLLGGGWTIVQSRVDGSVDFNSNWESYKEGFGELDGNFWYGNDRLHNLTKDQSNEILIFIEIEQNSTYYPMYDEFKVAGEEDKYRLTLGNYVPALGTNLSDLTNFEHHNGKNFSTQDQDNDLKEDGSCAMQLGSGWWFGYCFRISLNGAYGSVERAGIIWRDLTYIPAISYYKIVSNVKMMIRKKKN